MEFKNGDQVSAWKMGMRYGQDRIIGTYRGLEEKSGQTGAFALVEMPDGRVHKVRPKTLMRPQDAARHPGL